MANATCNSRVLEGTIRGTNFSISGIDESAQGLVQQFSLQFQRKLSYIYDLSSPGFYYIEGPSEGQVSFTKVVGPKGAPKLNCECEPRTLRLNAGETLCYPEDGDFQDASYTLLNALPFGLTGQGNASDFLIVFGISYRFNNVI